MRQVGEPSVEEILESIKKVIARDNHPAEAAPRHGQFGPQGNGTGIADEDEVLDLAEASEYLASAEEAPEGPLVPEQTVSSMRESLAALAMLAEPGAAPQIVRSGETSLEGLTRELLRPALAEWLDKNLPPLVERMVAAEIARIVGKKG